MADAMTFGVWMEIVVRGFEIAGVAVLAIGSLWALASAATSPSFAIEKAAQNASPTI
jgi:hypothetical protein